MNKYRESYATRQLPPPYIGKNGSLHGVFIEVDPNAVNNFCDIFLNLEGREDRKYEYRAIDEYSAAMVAVSEYEMSSQDAESDGTTKTSTTQSDGSDRLTLCQAYIGVPVHRFSVRPDNILTDPVVEWYYPLLVVNNTTTMFSYRETLGLDAIWGGIDVTPETTKVRRAARQAALLKKAQSDAGRPDAAAAPAADGQPGADSDFSVKVSVPMWKKFAAQSAQAPMPLLEMSMNVSERIGISTTNIERMRNNVQELQFIQAYLPQLYNLMTGSRSVFPMVSLKQFRDPGNTGNAAYQALMVADSSLEAIDRFFVYKADAVTLSFENSQMVGYILSTFLNLEASQFIPNRKQLQKGLSQPLRPQVALGFSLNMNSRIDNVRAIQTFYD
jgi:hypothetical protein